MHSRNVVRLCENNRMLVNYADEGQKERKRNTSLAVRFDSKKMQRQRVAIFIIYVTTMQTRNNQILVTHF